MYGLFALNTPSINHRNPNVYEMLLNPFISNENFLTTFLITKMKIIGNTNKL